jgi:rhamnogalacturonyl hydrolase YesR
MAAPSSGPAPGKTPATKADILPVMEKMADAQLKLYGENPPAGWVAGAFYVGLARLTHVSADPKYVEAEKKIAEKHGWEFKTDGGARHIAHADNECIGQMYIDLAVTTNQLEKLAAVRKQWDQIIAGFEDPSAENQRAWNNDVKRDGAAFPWWWCDAFFMAPPGLTRLSAVTGDKKYVDAMDKQWWYTTERLYDKQEHLFYRDNRFLTQKSPNGKKVFWSRGNGWVFAGTANLLTYLPKDYPSRPKYEALFKEMAAKLLSVQQADGMWRGSLVDPESANYPETSGTAFFTYGFAWGVNHGLLERGVYGPAAEKGWAALNRSIRPDGLIGYVQKIGDQPASTDAASTQPYAVGGYLLAGAEMIDLYAGR